MLKLLIVLSILFVVHCERRFVVIPGGELCDNSTWNSAGSLRMGASCSGLSELLQVVSSNVAPKDSVIIDIEGGNEYYLDASSYFVVPNISISINGISQSNNSRPRIICSLNRTLEDSLYALRFNHSSSVTLDRLEFIGCPRSLSFIDMLNVTITNSIFRNFTEGVISIADCNIVHLENLIVKDNVNSVLRSAMVGGLTSRGNAGGVSITYEKLIHHHRTALSFNVINCNFINDSTTSSLATSAFSTFLVENRVFAGTGGGLAIYLSDENAVTGNIRGCLFRNNHAAYYGGGLLIVDSKSLPPSHVITITNNSFIGNRADVGGGGALFGYIGGARVGQLLTIYVSECVFEHNRAAAGGGIFDISSLGNGRVTKIVIDNSTFLRNSARHLGSAYTVISFAQGFIIQGYGGVVDSRIITNCIFKDNDSNQGGTVSLLYYPVHFDGTNTFESNTGPTIRVIGAVLSINGTVRLHGNSATRSDGGALYSTSFGQVLLYKRSNLNFTKNRGNLGASIVAETQRVPRIFQQLLSNPLCFLLYEDKGVVPNEWSEINMLFEENDGYVGPVAFLDKLDLCAWDSTRPSYFNLDDVLKWKFVDYRRNNNINRGRDRNNKNEDYYIQTPAVDFNITEDKGNKDYFPDQLIELTIEAFDELKHFTAELLRFTDSLISTSNVMTMLMQSRRGRNMQPSTMTDQVTDDGSVILDTSPSLLSLMPKSKKYEIRYFFEGDSSAVMSSYHNLERHLSVDSPLLLNLRERQIRIGSKRCPPGHILKSISGVWGCQCNNELDELIGCVPQIGLLLQEGHWTYTYRDRDAVAFYQCPPGYCRCDQLGNISNDAACYAVLPNNDSNGQCVCDRKGVLCGECRDELGVSALLNRCVDCSNVNALLIVTLIIIDAIVVIIMLRWNPPFPTWMYPSLFYLQMAPYITEDFPVTFSKVHRYLYYISSAVSLYFPYDFCLYDGMTALESFAIRFVPFFVTISIISVLLITRRFVYKLRQYKFRHGIWFLVILQYSHVVHTSVSLLNCHSVPVSTDDSSRQATNDIRWYWDGSVKCFHGGHIPLGLLAMFILTFAILFVLVMLLSNFHSKFKKSQVPFVVTNFLRVASVPACVGYQEQCQWWVGVELGRRLIVLIFIIVFGHNEIPVLLILMIIFGVYTFVSPYKAISINILECLLCTILILVILLRNTANIVEELLVLVTDSNKQIVDGSCDSDSSGVTRLTALLTPFYYLLLVVPVCYCICNFPWRQAWENCCEIYERFRPQTSLVEEYELQEPRAYNVTEVEIDTEVDGKVAVSSSVAFQ